MKRTSLIIIGLLVAITSILAQNTQVIRGRVLDQQSSFQLVGASIVVLGSNPLIGTTTDLDGYFKLEGVSIGRQSLKISYLGYKDKMLSNIQVDIGKETNLEIQLEEEVMMTDEIIITADKREAINELNLTSSRQFSIEETSRYAGSFGDPARMAANYAGVGGGNDSRNDIIIRGNSPTGVLWRMEGLPIANPNHFGSLGSTGGPVSMLNNNTLSNSDFLTGAFPAEYGNATAGVFDLKMKNGNPEKHEFLGQIGFNGFEMGAEGPLNKSTRATYLANFRYSTLGVFEALGLDFGTGSAIPQYWDLSFRLNVPTKKSGTFSLFGIAGRSNVAFLESEKDSVEINNPDLYSQNGFDNTADFQSGSFGVTHKYFWNDKTYSRVGIAFSGNENIFTSDSLGKTATGIDPNIIVPFFRGNDFEGRTVVNFSVNKKISARNTFNIGSYVHFISFNYDQERWFEARSQWVPQVKESNLSTLTEGYAQWLHKVNNRFSFNIGIHSQYFFLNEDFVVEPRLGMKLAISNRQTVNFGYGLHGMAMPLSVYFVQTETSPNNFTNSNTNVGFTKSHHFVLGYQNSFAPNWRLKVEGYYQRLYDVPVEMNPSSFSMLNFGDDFGLPDVDSLINTGTGDNIGMELTIEKFLSKGYYTLLTGSFFNSTYKGSDRILRSTRYNGNYIINLLAGKEWKINEKGMFLANIKLTSSGGKRFSPIDINRSMISGETEIIEAEAFSLQHESYFRTDLKLLYRKQGKKVTQEFGIDIQNISNRKNVFSREYDRTDNTVKTVYQTGILPIPQYRILF